MDGSPQVVRFDATTLWHFDAAEWAPSTASNSVSDVRCTTAFPPKAEVDPRPCDVADVPKPEICAERSTRGFPFRAANI
jgi:hypothetical protein